MPIRKYFAGGICNPELFKTDLTNKIYIITGANTGIGFITALQLAKQKATVILACRDVARGEAAVSRIKSEVSSANITYMNLDLSDYDNIKSFVKEFKHLYQRLDCLVANAGVMIPPFSRTKQGHELQMGTNHLGHFLLAELLTDLLKSTNASRLVLVSSVAHKWGYINLKDLTYQPTKSSDSSSHRYYHKTLSYGASKLANLLYAQEFAKRRSDTGITAVSLHPGCVRTELTRHAPLFEKLSNTILLPFIATGLKTPWEGAQTTLHAVLSPVSELKNGAYYADCKEQKPFYVQKFIANNHIGSKLWDLSEVLVGFKGATNTNKAD